MWILFVRRSAPQRIVSRVDVELLELMMQRKRIRSLIIRLKTSFLFDNRLHSPTSSFQFIDSHELFIVLLQFFAHLFVDKVLLVFRVNRLLVRKFRGR